MQCILTISPFISYCKILSISLPTWFHGLSISLGKNESKIKQKNSKIQKQNQQRRQKFLKPNKIKFKKSLQSKPWSFVLVNFTWPRGLPFIKYFLFNPLVLCSITCHTLLLSLFFLWVYLKLHSLIPRLIRTPKMSQNKDTGSVFLRTLKLLFYLHFSIRDM